MTVVFVRPGAHRRHVQPFVQHGIDEESDEPAGDETSHDDYGERPLSIRSDASGKSGWQQSKAGTRAVIIIGRSRKSEASRVAL